MTVYGLLVFKLVGSKFTVFEKVQKVLSNNSFINLSFTTDSSQVVAWDQGFASYNNSSQKLLLV